MIGTHTDSLFADAYLKGITNFDVDVAYEASAKMRPFPVKVAKAVLAWNPIWSSDMSPPIRRNILPPERWNSAMTISVWLSWPKRWVKRPITNVSASSSMNYQNIFSPSVGFFRGKNADGSWRTSDANFKPNSWGHEWIEGCAWHYIAAPMHDGEGLAKLYGGRPGLEQKIDDLFRLRLTLIREVMAG